MKNFRFQLLILFLIAICASGCQPLIRPTETTNTTSSAKPVATALPSSASMVEFQTKGQGVALRFPNEWFVVFNDWLSLIHIFLPQLDTDTENAGVVARIMIRIMPYSEHDQKELAPSDRADGMGGITQLVQLSLVHPKVIQDLEQISDVEPLEFADATANHIIYKAVTVADEKAVHVDGISFISNGRSGLILIVIDADQTEKLQPTIDAILNSLVVSKESTIELSSSVYLVDKYLPANNPFTDLEKAKLIADEQNKTILLLVGGDWCITCHMLDAFIRDNPEIAEALQAQFVIVKVNYSEENYNEEFLNQFPLIEWFPHFFILNAQGDLLDSMDTRSLERGGYYDKDKFHTFLTQWAVDVQEEKPFSIVYDPARDPYADLEAAMLLAQTQNKRILLEVGGDWCIWCSILERFIDAHPEVEELLDANYVVVKVNVSDENDNFDFLSQFPEVAGYPHLFVLENDGSLLHSQNTGDLEQDESNYDIGKVTQFLTEWAP
jgi:thioredoxin-related protein